MCNVYSLHVPPQCSKICFEKEAEETVAVKIGLIVLSTIASLMAILIFCKIPAMHNLGTSSGGVLFTLGISVLLEATFFKCIRKISLHSSSSTFHLPAQSEQVTNYVNETINFEKVISIKDLGNYLFSFFSSSELIKVSSTCKDFYKLTRQNCLWKQLVKKEQKAFDDFSPLVEKGLCTWFDVSTQLTPLSSFLKSIGEWQSSHEPALSQKFHSSSTFSIKHGDFWFYIHQHLDVKILDRLGNERIIKGLSTYPLIRLAAENHFLFALRQDGMIIQWDFNTEKVIQTFASRYVNDFCQQQIDAQRGGLPSNHPQFFVFNKQIIFKYKSDFAEGSLIEIIPYLTPENARWGYFDIHSHEKIEIYREKIFFLSQKKIYEIHFSLKDHYCHSHQIEKDSNFKLNDFFIDHDTLYASSTNGSTYFYDLEKQKIIGSLFIQSCDFKRIIVRNHVLFGFNSYSKERTFHPSGFIWIIDLYTGHVLEVLDNIFQEETFDLADNILEEIVVKAAGAIAVSLSRPA